MGRCTGTIGTRDWILVVSERADLLYDRLFPVDALRFLNICKALDLDLAPRFCGRKLVTLLRMRQPSIAVFHLRSARFACPRSSRPARFSLLANRNLLMPLAVGNTPHALVQLLSPPIRAL